MAQQYQRHSASAAMAWRQQLVVMHDIVWHHMAAAS